MLQTLKLRCPNRNTSKIKVCRTGTKCDVKQMLTIFCSDAFFCMILHLFLHFYLPTYLMHIMQLSLQLHSSTNTKNWGKSQSKRPVWNRFHNNWYYLCTKYYFNALNAIKIFCNFCLYIWNCFIDNCLFWNVSVTPIFARICNHKPIAGWFDSNLRKCESLSILGQRIAANPMNVILSFKRLN